MSEVSNHEFVQLVSTFWFRADESFNCFSCKKKMSAGVRDRQKACFTPRDREIVNYNGSIKYFTCPSNHYNAGTSRLIDMFRHFQQGVLPFEGGLLDQPAKIIEVFRIVENLEIERQNDIAKRNQWQKIPSKSNSRLKNKKH